jgi:hypothetical protein
VGSEWIWIGFWFATAALLPGVIIQLVLGVRPRWMERVQRRLTRLIPRRLRRARRSDVLSVERLAADLHRLAVHLDTLERSDEMHRVARLRAASLAYDDVLLSACRTLQVDVPDRTPLHPVERLQTEAALAQRGLVW